MKKHGRICGRHCLGPVHFLSEETAQEKCLASSDTLSHTNGLAFLCRPVKVNEKIRIRIENGDSSQHGHKAFKVGFTNHIPRTVLNPPTAQMQPLQCCVAPVPEELCQLGEEIEFWINHAKLVMIRGMDRNKYFMMAKGLHVHDHLYVFLDLFGSTSVVRLLGSRKKNRTSCPVTPSDQSDETKEKDKALEDNLLNLTLISNQNVNSDQRLFEEESTWQTSLPPSPRYSTVSPQRPDRTMHRQTSVDKDANKSRQSSMEEKDVTLLLRAFQQQHISSSKVHVIIWRKRLLKSALDALSSSNFGWNKTPRIMFAGEEAFDNGGPRRELFRLLMLELQNSLGIFEGKPGNLFFTYDQSALQQRKYEQAGKLVAWSVIHGGPGLKALDPCFYQLMCGVETELSDFDWRLIPDLEVQKRVQKILSCRTDAELCTMQKELGDWICDCGFPGIYGPNLSIQDIPKIYSYVVRHYIYLRVSNMINQFTEGLNSYGRLWDTMKANWVDFLPIFTTMSERISRSSFRALFQISWSQEGSKKREEEEETTYYWELVLKMIEDKETELTFEELLVFITATDEVPVLGFQQKLSINFYQPESRGSRLPYSSTCMMGLFLPRGVKSPVELNKMLLRAVRESTGFGKS